MRTCHLNLDWTSVRGISVARGADPQDVINEAVKLGLRVLENNPTSPIPARDLTSGFKRWLRDVRGWKARSAETAAGEVHRSFATGVPHRRARLWEAYVETCEAEEV